MRGKETQSAREAEIVEKEAERDLQRLTEPDREAQAAAKRCIDSLAGRDRERYIQRQIGRDRE